MSRSTQNELEVLALQARLQVVALAVDCACAKVARGIQSNEVYAFRSDCSDLHRNSVPDSASVSVEHLFTSREPILVMQMRSC